jgi:hypothetical protein
MIVWWDRRVANLEKIPEKVLLLLYFLLKKIQLVLYFRVVSETLLSNEVLFWTFVHLTMLRVDLLFQRQDIIQNNNEHNKEKMNHLVFLAIW